MAKTFGAGILILLMFGLGRVGRLDASQKAEPTPLPDPIEKALAQGTENIKGVGVEQSPSLQRRDPRYRVGDGDVLVLTFNFTPEFNQTVTVQPDGFITLQSIGDLHVEGKTVPEIRTDLGNAYGKILHNPEISVTLKDFQAPYFLALGQVAKPGKYDLRGDTTLTQAVAEAGGFTTQAKHSQVLLFRRVSDNWVSVQKVDLKHMLGSGNLSEDLHLRPGDMVYIPQNTVSKIKPFLPLPSLSFLLGHYTL
jgi:protein involved in polysaccharide export with SLBB domain